MDLKLKLTGDTINMVFLENGSTSDVVFLVKEDAKKMLVQAQLAVQKQNDTASLRNGDWFTFVKQDNGMFLLSFSITEKFAKGYLLNYKQLKQIMSDVKRLLKTIK